jgi:hypothetical protein
MRQTAVEWLKEKLYSEYGDTLCCELSWDQLDELYEQAKAMEKEQIRTIVLAYQEERNGRSDGAQNQWEPYEVDEFLENYNETFKSNEK